MLPLLRQKLARLLVARLELLGFCRALQELLGLPLLLLMLLLLLLLLLKPQTALQLVRLLLL